MFSEDMGLFYASPGVANGSAIGETSGYQCIYAPVTFKISDDMKVGGVIGYLRADTMQNGSHWNGGKADKELGWEVDVNFEWRFMDNLSYIMNAGYFFTGGYSCCNSLESCRGLGCNSWCWVRDFQILPDC